MESFLVALTSPGVWIRFLIFDRNILFFICRVTFCWSHCHRHQLLQMKLFYIFHKLWCSCLDKSPSLIGIVIFLIIKCISNSRSLTLRTWTRSDNSASSSFSFLLKVNLLHPWHHIATWTNCCWLAASVQDWNNKFGPYKGRDDGQWYYGYSLIQLDCLGLTTFETEAFDDNHF